MITEKRNLLLCGAVANHSKTEGSKNSRPSCVPWRVSKGQEKLYYKQQVFVMLSLIIACKQTTYILLTSLYKTAYYFCNPVQSLWIISSQHNADTFYTVLFREWWLDLIKSLRVCSVHTVAFSFSCFPSVGESLDLEPIKLKIHLYYTYYFKLYS